VNRAAIDGGRGTLSEHRHREWIDDLSASGFKLAD
jgi:hypothetical protein